MSGSTVFAGGAFTRIGGQARDRIGAIDAVTGAPTAWNPGADHYVMALAVSGSNVYAGGYFRLIGGQLRNYLAAVDVTTGVTTSWYPRPDRYVHAIVVGPSAVYVGGEFDMAAAVVRHRAAAFNITNAAPTSWNPNADNSITALAMSGSTVYLGGFFNHVGGRPRNFVAAVDAITSEVTDFDPSSNGVIRSFAVSGPIVYAGGGYTTIGGQTRYSISALDAATGAATAWNPGAQSDVSALALIGSSVYAGGYFLHAGGQPHSYLAAFESDLPTPTLLSLVSARATRDRVELEWFAPAGDVSGATVYRRTDQEDWEAVGQILADGTGRLVYQDTRVTAGTRYGYRLGVMDGGQQTFLGETWVDVPVALELALAGFRSNPVRDDRSVAFSLVDASPARLELFDVGGRKIAAREVGTLGAGSHVVTLGGGQMLTPAVYLLRLSQAARSIRARAVFVR